MRQKLVNSQKLNWREIGGTFARRQHTGKETFLIKILKISEILNKDLEQVDATHIAKILSRKEL